MVQVWGPFRATFLFVKISHVNDADLNIDAKETFDCKGGARVTFSIQNLCVDVWYHHLPIHDSAFELDRVKSVQGKKEQQDMAR